MNKRLICLSLGYAIAGFANVFIPSETFNAIYAASSASLFAITAIGGFARLRDQHNIDRDEILQEYVFQYKEKIAKLEEQVIAMEKQLMQKNVQRPETSQAEPEEEYW